jgi:hypothetical protein
VLPNPADSSLGALESLRRLHARQAVPDRQEPIGGPIGSQLRQFLFCRESLRAGANGNFGLVCGGESDYVVLGIDRKRCHFDLLFRADRGHDIDHSEVVEKQGNSARNQSMRRAGDDVCQELSEGAR